MAVIWTRNTPKLALTLPLILLVVATTWAETTDGSSATNMSPMEAGLKTFYSLTEEFLDLLRSPDTWSGDLFPAADLISGVGGAEDLVTYAKDNPKEFTNYFLGFVICVAIGVLFIILMFFGGMCFCCCRCCGKCGANVEKNAGRRGKCRRISCGVVMFMFTTTLLVSVALVFLSNEMIHQRISSEQNFLQGAVGRIEQIESFVGEVTRVYQKVTTDVEEFIGTIITKLLALPQDAQAFLDEMFDVTEILSTGTQLAATATRIQGLLTEVKLLTNNLTAKGADLDSTLIDLKDDLLTDLNNCPSSIQTDCQIIEFSITNMETVADFSMVYNIQSQLDDVSSVIGHDLSGLIEEGKQQFDSIRTEVDNAIDRHVQDAIREVNSIVADIRSGVNVTVNLQLVHIREEFDTYKMILMNLSEDVKQYGDYWRYGGISIGCILLIVVVLYYFGLALGCCGDPPYDGGTCNRGVGASLMLGGVIWTFVFSWLIMILLIALFVTGGMAHTELCRPLRTLGGTNSSREVLRDVFDALRDQGITDQLEADLASTTYDFTLSCYNNDTAYTTLSLQRYFDVEVKLDLDTYNVQDFLDIPDSMRVELNNVIIASDEVIQELENLRDSDLNSIDFETFRTQLDSNIVNQDLLELALQLDSLASSARNEDAAFADKLMVHANTLRNIHSTIVSSIEQLMMRLRAVISDLENAMDPPIQVEVQNLIESLLRAQERIVIEGPGSLQMFVSDQVHVTYNGTKQFLDQVAYHITYDYASMAPVHSILKGFIQDDMCYDTVTSINVFWFSLGWSLIMFIPCLIVALCLNREYRKDDLPNYSNHKSFDDPNFDAYVGMMPGDNIPLEDYERRDTRPDGHQNRAYQRDNQYRNGAPAYPGGREGGFGWNARHHGGVPPSGPPSSAPPNPPHYHNNRARAY